MNQRINGLMDENESVVNVDMTGTPISLEPSLLATLHLLWSKLKLYVESLLPSSCQQRERFASPLED